MTARSHYCCYDLRSRPSVSYAVRRWTRIPGCTKLRTPTPQSSVSASHEPTSTSNEAHDTKNSKTTLPKISRRLCFGTVLAWMPAQHASAIQSSSWAHPVVLTIYNDTAAIIKIYWLNYDGAWRLFSHGSTKQARRPLGSTTSTSFARGALHKQLVTRVVDTGLSDCIITVPTT